MINWLFSKGDANSKRHVKGGGILNVKGEDI